MLFTKEVKVGLLVTVSLTLIYTGINYLKGEEIYPTRSIYYVSYNDAKGLTTANQVTLKGFQVGKVKQVEILPEQGYQVRATLAIAKDIKLTNNTVARLVESNLLGLGNKAIELIINEGELLKNHGTLLSEIEQDLTTRFVESALPIIDDARALTALMNKFIQNMVENTGRINAIFTNLEKTSEQFQKTITNNQQNLTSISHDIASISRSFSDEETGVKPLLVNINQLLEEATVLKVHEIIINLNNILTELEKGPLYKNVDQMIVDLDKLIVDLQTHPNRYMHFSIFGRNSTLSKPRKKAHQLSSQTSTLQPSQRTPSTMTKGKDG